jgi:hypothetical protein
MQALDMQALDMPPVAMPASLNQRVASHRAPRVAAMLAMAAITIGAEIATEASTRSMPRSISAPTTADC